MARQLSMNIVRNVSRSGLSQWIGQTGLPSRLAQRQPQLVLNTILKKQSFHTSPKRNINPIFLIILKPIGKLTAMITGRHVRKTWAAASPEKRKMWKEAIWRARYKIAAVGGIVSLVASINFLAHLQETPVTKRRRFIAFTDKQFLKLATYNYEQQMELFKDSIVDPKHPIYEKVCGIAQNIVNSNQDFDFFRNQKWTVIIVDSEEENAYVLPTGHIFVYTGLIRLTGLGSKLAVVLGHEMAHAFLSHSAEQVSVAAVLDWLIIIVMSAIWIIVPNDGIALVTQWFYNKVCDIFLHLPYSRKLEEEADYVGLQLAAKACYDVRESSAFWDLMDIKENYAEHVPPPEFLSTHPASKNRAQTLDDFLGMAMKLRESCNCPALPSKDPRLEIHAFRVEIESDMKKKKEKEEAEREEAKKKAQVIHPNPNIQPEQVVLNPVIKSAKS